MVFRSAAKIKYIYYKNKCKLLKFLVVQISPSVSDRRCGDVYQLHVIYARGFIEVNYKYDFYMKRI